MAHELLRSLPPDELERVELALQKGADTVALARQLKQRGLFPESLTEASLSRALRRYRFSALDVPQAARQEALAQTKNAETRRAISEQVSALTVHARWKKLIDAAERTHWTLTKQLEKLGSAGMTLQNDKLRTSSAALSRLYSEYSAFLFTSGLVAKAPTDVRIMASMVVIRSPEDAGQILERLIDYVNRSDTPDRYLQEATGRVKELIENGPTPRQVMLPKPAPMTLDQVGERFAATLARLGIELPDEESDEPVQVAGEIPVEFDVVESVSLPVAVRPTLHLPVRVPVLPEEVQKDEPECKVGVLEQRLFRQSDGGWAARDDDDGQPNLVDVW